MKLDLNYFKHHLWFITLLLLLMAVFNTPAIAAPTASFSAVASGPTNKLTLTGNIKIADADLGINGNYYLAVNFQQMLFFNDGARWVQYVSSPAPVFAKAALADRSMEVVRNQDLTSLIGAEVYVGYGLSEADMLANNKFAKVYTVIANTVPTVSATTIVNGAVSIPTNTVVGATFSEPMDPASMTATTVTLLQGTSPVLGTVSYSGNSVVFTPTNPLASNASYTATIKSGNNGAKSMADIAIASDFSWSWTTAAIVDATAPTVTTTVTANGATGVGIGSPISAAFSEAMDPSTLSATTVTLKQGATTVLGSVSYTGSNAVFTPTNPLSGGLNYTATITGGAAGAKDLAGNALVSDYVWSWTTAADVETTPPLVTGTVIANGATGVALNASISAAFNEAMDAASLAGTTLTVKQGVTPVAGTVSYSGANLVFTPSSLLDNNSTYTATIKGGSNGAKDLAGNALLTDYVWSWTTVAATPMTLGPAPVLLGTAGNFLILAKTGISSVPTSILTGDIGVSPAAASFVTGFSLTADATNVFSTSTQVVGGGKVYAANMAVPTPSNLTTAVLDMQTAYTDAAGRPTPDFLNLSSGNIGGLTLVPGLYKFGSSVTIPSDVVLSGAANDVWIFQMSGDLIMSNAKRMTLSGGAQAKNIFWQVAGQVTIGTTAHFEGNILSQTGITLQTGASMTGRALAQTLVALDSATMTKPAP